jgi:hypothetical protein
MVSDNTSYGVFCQSSSAVAKIENSYIQGNGCSISTYSNNVKYLTKPITITGNNVNDIAVYDGDINTGTWSNLGVPYRIYQDAITVLNGQTWTIEKGTQIKMNGYYQLRVLGTLVADGSAEEPIVFTSGMATPAAGNWKNLSFDNADAGCVLNNCHILYAGGTSYYGNVYMVNSGSNVSLDSCLIAYSKNAGLYLSGSSPSIKHCTITENKLIGVRLTGASAPVFGTDENEWNYIFNNTSYQFYNSTTAITAEYIFWGSTECFSDIDVLIWDDEENATLGAVDFWPFITNSGISFHVPTIWTGTESSDWFDNDNWSNCEPTAENDAQIPESTDITSFPVLSADGVTKNLTIKPHGQLTVQSGNTLTVNGNLVLEAKNDSSASVIDNGGIVVTGETSAELYITDNRWHYISSPVSAAVSMSFLDLYPIEYQEYNDTWFYITPTDVPHGIGKGWATWSKTEETGTVVLSLNGGVLNTGNIEIPVTATDRNSSGNIGDGEGWNLAGNPYPSAMDWDLAGWTKTNIDGTVYVWDGTQYITWNGSVGALTNGIVPAMQSFMVKAHTFNPYMRVTNATRLHGPAPYKSETSVSNLITITASGNGYTDKTFIHFTEDATIDFDHQSDAYKMSGISQAPQLYSIIADINLAVNTLPLNSEINKVDLGFESEYAGEYTLKFGEPESFTITGELYLEDLITGEINQVVNGFEYSFFSEPIDPYNRFMLHFGPLGTGENHTEKLHSVYSNEGSIYINSSDIEDNYLVKVINMQGMTVYAGQLNGGGLKQIEVDGSGIYIISLIAGGTVSNTKLFVD